MMRKQFGTLAGVADKLREDDEHDRAERAKRIRSHYVIPWTDNELQMMLRTEVDLLTDDPEERARLHWAIRYIDMNDYRQAMENGQDESLRDETVTRMLAGIGRQ